MAGPGHDNEVQYRSLLYYYCYPLEGKMQELPVFWHHLDMKIDFQVDGGEPAD